MKNQFTPTIVRLSKRTVVTCLLMIGIVPAIQATDFYVSKASNAADSPSSNGSSSSPWRTIRYALSRAAASPGQPHVIKIAAGEYIETGVLDVPANISLDGAGRSFDPATGTVVKALINWDLTQNYQGYTNGKNATDGAGWENYSGRPDKFVVRIRNGVSGQFIRDIAFLGRFTHNSTAYQCHGAIYADNLNGVTLQNLGAEDFRFTALWLPRANNLTVKDCVLRKNAFGNKRKSMGNLMYHDLDNSLIENNYIAEAGVNGRGNYGITGMTPPTSDTDLLFKATAGLTADEWNRGIQTLTCENVTVRNNRILVPASGTWGDNSSLAITLETGSNIRNWDVYDNVFNNHCSFVGNYKQDRNGSNYTDYYETGKSVRVHHNTFTLYNGFRYGVELNVPNAEIDHNYFYGGQNVIAQFQTERTNWRESDVEVVIHHNVFYDQTDGNFFNFKTYPNAFQFYNNTVVDTKGLNKYFAHTTTSTPTANAAIRNNIFLRTYDNASGTNLFDATAFASPVLSHNLYYKLAPFNTAPTNVTVAASAAANSILKMTGSVDAAQPYFELTTSPVGSPAKEKAVNISGITTNTNGTQPDIGAIEAFADYQGRLVGCRVTTPSGARQGAAEAVSIADELPIGEPEWVIFPNPAVDQTIHLRLSGPIPAQIRLLNTEGREHNFRQTLQSDGTLTIKPEQRLPTGLYLLHLQTESGPLTRKVIFN